MAKGCPEPTAHALADRVRLGHDGGWPALVDGPARTHGHGVDVPVTADRWTGVVHHLVEIVAAGNAQAVDRAARGEPGWTPAWQSPGRAPRT